MSAGLSDLKHKIAELEAKQQVTQAPSKPNPGGVPALRRMFTYAALLIIVPIFVFAIANYEATPARGVSTVADVVAYQKKAEETLAQIYRYCDHAVEVEERENGDLGYFGRTAFKGKCQRRMLGLDNASNGGAPSEPPGPNWGVLNLQQCYRLGALAWSALFFYASHPMVEAPT